MLRTQEHLMDVDEYFKKNETSKYIIHVYGGYFGFENKTYGVYIIDNYGDYIFYCNGYYQNYNVITVREDRLRHLQLSFSDKKSKYILPNILIDLIKKMSNMNLIIESGNISDRKYNILDCFKVIAEDYYKKLTQKSGSVELEELNKQYLKQIEQLTEENIKLKDNIQKPKEITVISPYDNILFQEIKELQNQLEESKNEISKLNKKLIDNL